MNGAAYSKYGSYKSTNAERIEQVPAGWKILRVQDFSTVNDDVVREHDYRNRKIRYVDISGVEATSNTYTFEEQDFNNAPSRARRLAKAGDTVFSTVRPYLKAVATINDPEESLVFSTGFAVIRPKSNADSRFVGYVLRNDHFIDEVSAHSVGASYPAINASDLVKLHVLLPPLPEQRAIAAFLDGKCATIDEAMRIKEAQIKLLRERRQILIQQAVTRGLNPNAPMKDSGIDWIGRIPAHWEGRKIRHLFEIGRGRVIPKEDLIDGGLYPVFSSQTKNEGIFGYLDSFDFEVDQLTWTTDGANAGSVFRRRGRHNCTNVCGTLRPKTGNVDLDFCVYAVGHAAIFYKRPDTNGAKIMNEEMAAIEFPLPPLDEQNKLARAIDNQSAKINDAISIKQSQVAALKEYKTVLINAAVTGKIKVTEGNS